MPFQMPITKRRIRHHFQYSLWMYLLLAALALFGWNLIYTTTRYQPPEELRVEFFVQSSTADTDSLQALADRIHEQVMPDMELVTAQPVTISDDYYGDMQMTVWISAAQGDIYMIKQDYFDRFAPSGAFVDLQPYADAGTLNTSGLELSAGMAALTDSEPGMEGKRLFGIPADKLTGFSDYAVDTSGLVLCVLYRNGNDETVIRFLDYLLTNLR